MMCTGYVLFFVYLVILDKQGCPAHCAACQDESICDRCDEGYGILGQYCYLCPKGCEKCSNGSYCSKCKPNFWDNRPYQQCGRSCHENCGDLGCDDATGYCYECKTGLYGISCEHNCALCANGACELLKCQSGCINGYYEDAISGFKTCQKCYGNCILCGSQTNCTECANGFYLQSKTHNNNVLFFCDPCPSNCERCNEYFDCSVCIPGKYGTSCSSDCGIPYCHRCIDKDNVVICTECVNGYTLRSNTCIVGNNNCSQHCANVCDRNENCLGDCIDGFTGLQCTKNCASNCRTCDKNDEDFCTMCQGDFYTNNCSVPCSSHCSASFDRVTCNINNGTCSNGCNEGYTGDNCENEIPYTLLTSTPQASGTDRILEQSQQNVGIIGAGAGGGLLILIVVVVSIVCLVKSRRTKNEASCTIKYDEETLRKKPQNDLDDMYARPNNPRKEQSQDYIYAQPNKPRKSAHHNKEEKSGPRKMYDNIVINLKTNDNTKGGTNGDSICSEEAAETDIDAVLLENIDDEPKSVIETEVIIPASDTYYNMAGLIRSRVQISKLFEYIKDKRDFETEFEKLPKGLTRTCNEALKPHNRAKNRYNGIYAYDATRVVLQSKIFINANYIEDHGQSGITYIASLGPTKSTMHNFETFWEMVWQEKSNKIVMLTNLDESQKMKCEQYWPHQGRRDIYGDFTVTCTAENLFSDFVVRKLTVEQVSETRQVTHYQYTAWPDKTVPHTVASLIEFRDKVEQEHTPITGPMIVHCSAGIGRTGTYIALNIMIRAGKKENFVDIFGCVIALRGQRVKLVQNVEQYIFLHLGVLYALTCEPDTLPVTAIPHVFTDEKIATQYQSLYNMRLLRGKDKRLILQAKSRKENRKGADIPDDEHRVRLTLTKHDYINAVYVNGYEETNKFVLAQTPLPNTVEDFVSMLYQERCSYIVSLDEENIKDKTVAQYIPPANKVSTFGHFQVSCTRSDPKEDFIFRELKISRIGSPPAKALTVRHYQFKGWDISNTVPKTISSFLNIIQEVEKARKSSHSKQPIVVHCLTGSERSGLFCVVSVLLEKMAVEKELSVLNTICQVRSRRRSVVKDIEQLRFCYNCVEEMLEMPDTNTYYNISNV